MKSDNRQDEWTIPGVFSINNSVSFCEQWEDKWSRTITAQTFLIPISTFVLKGIKTPRSSLVLLLLTQLFLTQSHPSSLFPQFIFLLTHSRLSFLVREKPTSILFALGFFPPRNRPGVKDWIASSLSQGDIRKHSEDCWEVRQGRAERQ